VRRPDSSGWLSFFIASILNKLQKIFYSSSIQGEGYFCSHAFK